MTGRIPGRNPAARHATDLDITADLAVIFDDLEAIQDDIRAT